MNSDQKGDRRILVAVDDSDAAARAVDYVGRVLGGHPQAELLLYHRLPPLPPELRDHGGSENPRREAELDEQQSRRISDWAREHADQARPVLERHRDRLVQAGLGADAVSVVLDDEVTPGERLGQDLRRAAHERGCRTIVIAREHYSGIRESLARHASDELARHPEGFAIWVVD